MGIWIVIGVEGVWVVKEVRRGVAERFERDRVLVGVVEYG